MTIGREKSCIAIVGRGEELDPMQQAVVDIQDEQVGRPRIRDCYTCATPINRVNEFRTRRICDDCEMKSTSDNPYPMWS